MSRNAGFKLYKLILAFESILHLQGWNYRKTQSAVNLCEDTCQFISIHPEPASRPSAEFALLGWLNLSGSVPSDGCWYLFPLCNSFYTLQHTVGVLYFILCLTRLAKFMSASVGKHTTGIYLDTWPSHICGSSTKIRPNLL